MSQPLMRAKLKVINVAQGETADTVAFMAVYKDGAYPTDGSDEDNTFARFTPSADLTMVINNPNLLGKLKVGDKYYLDFTKAER